MIIFKNRKKLNNMILTLLFLSVIILTIITGLFLNYEIIIHMSKSRIFYYCMSIFISGVIMILFKVYGLNSIYVVVCIYGLLLLFINPYYSPIDEGAHFDYINHIIEFKKLPTLYDYIDSNQLSKITSNAIPGGMQYEAVHPPLYYLIGSGIGFFLKDELLRFFSLRVLGLFFILASIYLIIKIYNYLCNKELCDKDDFCLYSVIILLTISPGFLTRMTTISNEHLVVLLMCVFFTYYIKRMINNNFRGKEIITLSIISISLILTKLTAAYVIAIPMYFLFKKKNYKQLIYYLGLTFLLVFPWIIFNFVNYGSLTGTKIHVDYVKTIVNPGNVSFGIIHILDNISRLWITFWNPQEADFSNLNESKIFITNILNFFMIIAMLNFCHKLYFNIKNKENNRTMFNYILIIPIILNILLLIYATVSQSIDVLIGRYLYMNLLPFTLILFFFNKDVINKEYRRVLPCIFILSTVLLTNNYIFGIISQKNYIS